MNLPIALWCSLNVYAQSPLELIQATYFGTAADDDLFGGAQSADGSIYLAGNTGTAITTLPGDVVTFRYGADAVTPKCGHGFIMRLSTDGQKVLAYAEFGAGIASMTTVQVNAKGIYLAGYATEYLAPLLIHVPGFMRTYPLPKDANPLQDNNSNEAPGVPKTGPMVAHLPQPKAAGAPFVLRLSTDLSSIEAGTYLEGWQQVWPKARYIPRKLMWPQEKVLPKDGFWKCWPTEFTWHPTFLGFLKDGEVVVGHDGGYSRELTPSDEALLAKIEDKAAAAKMRERLRFYDVCDYVSKFSADLERRIYRKEIYSPAISTEHLNEFRPGWPKTHYGNPRTHQMRIDTDDHIYVAGWSASNTSKEPWWSPYLWKLRGSDGSLVWKAYEYDPMSGEGNRMGGIVADTGIGALALDSRNHLLVALLSDGGNHVMHWSPRAILNEPFEGPTNGGGHTDGLVHFHGQIHRISSETRTGLVRTRIGPWGWVMDLTVSRDDRILAVGRSNYDFHWTPDAWQTADRLENPTGWLRLYSSTLGLTFSTALRGFWPRAIVPLSGDQYLIAGESKGELHRLVLGEGFKFETIAEPNPGLAPVQKALYEKPIGGSDAYWLIVKLKR